MSRRRRPAVRDQLTSDQRGISISDRGGPDKSLAADLDLRVRVAVPGKTSTASTTHHDDPRYRHRHTY
jgi:hypothetical protein